MLNAIQEIAQHRPDEQKEHLAALAYFKACNLLFENGIHPLIRPCPKFSKM